MMQVTLDSTTDAMAPASVTDPISRNAYTPYGAVRGVDNLTISKGWLNQVSDEASTGLVYLNARYYDTGTSRFVSPDPLMNPADPRTLDAFRYANNNPVAYTDASGLGPVCTGLSGTALANCNSYGNTTANYMAGAKKQSGPSFGQDVGALGKGAGRTLWDTIWAIAIEPMGAVQIARFAASPSFYVKEKWDQASAARSAWWSSTKSAWSFFTGGGQTWSGHWKQVDQDFTGGVYHGDDTLAKWQTSGSLGMTVLITLFGPKVIKSFGIEPGVAADSESSLLRSANAARDAELSRLTGVRSAERPATVVGAYNTRTGSVAVGSSSKVLAECAEACAARNVGGDIADIGFTTAFRPNGSGAPFRPVRVCEAFCEPTYGRDAFSDPSTLFQSDQ